MDTDDSGNRRRTRWRDMYATPRAADPLPLPIAHPPDAAERRRLRLLRLATRAAAVAAGSEAEWVRRVRASGVALTRVQDPDGAITRYLAQWHDPRDAEPGAAFLDADLGTDLLLSELRTGWPRGGAAAEIEWRTPSARFGRESVPLSDPAVWARAVADAAACAAALSGLAPFDRDGWAWAAGRVAGVLAIWSCRAEPEPGPLAVAGEELAMSAARRGGRRPPGTGPDLGHAAYVLTQIRADARDAAAERLIMRSLGAATTAIAAAHLARGENARARRLRAHVETVLAGWPHEPPAPRAARLRRYPATA